VQARAQPTPTATAWGRADRREYEQICAAWWGPTGTLTNWLKNYKTYVLNDIAAPQQKLDASLLMQFDMLGVPSTGFASIAALVAIREYQWKARDLYGLRPRRQPEPTVLIIN
jgi:hypothetical protein